MPLVVPALAGPGRRSLGCSFTSMLFLFFLQLYTVNPQPFAYLALIQPGSNLASYTKDGGRASSSWSSVSTTDTLSTYLGAFSSPSGRTTLIFSKAQAGEIFAITWYYTSELWKNTSSGLPITISTIDIGDVSLNHAAWVRGTDSSGVGHVYTWTGGGVPFVEATTSYTASSATVCASEMSTLVALPSGNALAGHSVSPYSITLWTPLGCQGSLTLESGVTVYGSTTAFTTPSAYYVLLAVSPTGCTGGASCPSATTGGTLYAATITSSTSDTTLLTAASWTPFAMSDGGGLNYIGCYYTLSYQRYCYGVAAWQPPSTVYTGTCSSTTATSGYAVYASLGLNPTLPASWSVRGCVPIVSYTLTVIDFRTLHIAGYSAFTAGLAVMFSADYGLTFRTMSSLPSTFSATGKLSIVQMTPASGGPVMISGMDPSFHCQAVSNLCFTSAPSTALSAAILAAKSTYLTKSQCNSVMKIASAVYDFTSRGTASTTAILGTVLPASSPILGNSALTYMVTSAYGWTGHYYSSYYSTLQGSTGYSGCPLNFGYLNKTPSSGFYGSAGPIEDFFTGLAWGTTDPRMIMIPEINKALYGNNLVDMTAIDDNVLTLARFVSTGGGLYVVGYQGPTPTPSSFFGPPFNAGYGYGFLSTLTPKLKVQDSIAGSAAVAPTTAGYSNFPTLSQADIASPWHTAFAGGIYGKVSGASFGVLACMANETVFGINYCALVGGARISFNYGIEVQTIKCFVGASTVANAGLTVHGTATTQILCTATSGLAVTLSSSTTSICTLTSVALGGPPLGTLVGVPPYGDCVFTASQAGDEVYAAATSISITVVMMAPSVTPSGSYSITVSPSYSSTVTTSTSHSPSLSPSSTLSQTTPPTVTNSPSLSPSPSLSLSLSPSPCYISSPSNIPTLTITAAPTTGIPTPSPSSAQTNTLTTSLSPSGPTTGFPSATDLFSPSTALTFTPAPTTGVATFTSILSLTNSGGVSASCSPNPTSPQSSSTAITTTSFTAPTSPTPPPTVSVSTQSTLSSTTLPTTGFSSATVTSSRSPSTTYTFTPAPTTGITTVSSAISATVSITSSPTRSPNPTTLLASSSSSPSTTVTISTSPLPTTRLSSNSPQSTISGQPSTSLSSSFGGTLSPTPLRSVCGSASLSLAPSHSPYLSVSPIVSASGPSTPSILGVGMGGTHCGSASSTLSVSASTTLIATLSPLLSRTITTLLTATGPASSTTVLPTLSGTMTLTPLASVCGSASVGSSLSPTPCPTPTPSQSFTHSIHSSMSPTLCPSTSSSTTPSACHSGTRSGGVGVGGSFTAIPTNFPSTSTSHSASPSISPSSIGSTSGSSSPRAINSRCATGTGVTRSPDRPPPTPSSFLSSSSTSSPSLNPSLCGTASGSHSLSSSKSSHPSISKSPSVSTTPSPITTESLSSTASPLLPTPSPLILSTQSPPFVSTPTPLFSSSLVAGSSVSVTSTLLQATITSSPTMPHATATPYPPTASGVSHSSLASPSAPLSTRSPLISLTGSASVSPSYTGGNGGGATSSPTPCSSISPSPRLPTASPQTGDENPANAGGTGTGLPSSNPMATRLSSLSPSTSISTSVTPRPTPSRASSTSGRTTPTPWSPTPTKGGGINIDNNKDASTRTPTSSASNLLRTQTMTGSLGASIGTRSPFLGATLTESQTPLVEGSISNAPSVSGEGCSGTSSPSAASTLTPSSKGGQGEGSNSLLPSVSPILRTPSSPPSFTSRPSVTASATITTVLSETPLAGGVDGSTVSAHETSSPLVSQSLGLGATPSATPLAPTATSKGGVGGSATAKPTLSVTSTNGEVSATPLKSGSGTPSRGGGGGGSRTAQSSPTSLPTVSLGIIRDTASPSLSISPPAHTPTPLGPKGGKGGGSTTPVSSPSISGTSRGGSSTPRSRMEGGEGGTTFSPLASRSPFSSPTPSFSSAPSFPTNSMVPKSDRGSLSPSPSSSGSESGSTSSFPTRSSKPSPEDPSSTPIPSLSLIAGSDTAGSTKSCCTTYTPISFAPLHYLSKLLTPSPSSNPPLPTLVAPLSSGTQSTTPTASSSLTAQAGTTGETLLSSTSSLLFFTQGPTASILPLLAGLLLLCCCCFLAAWRRRGKRNDGEEEKERFAKQLNPLVAASPKATRMGPLGRGGGGSIGKGGSLGGAASQSPLKQQLQWRNNPMILG